MNPRAWFCLGLFASSLLLGCSTLTDKRPAQTSAPQTRDITTNTTSTLSKIKRALVVAETSNAALREVLAAGGAVTHSLPLLNAVGAELSPKSISLLSESTDVFNIVVDDSSASQNVAASAAIDWLIQKRETAPQNAWLDSLANSTTHGLTGSGIGLAIVDTGIAETEITSGWNPKITARYNAITDTEGQQVNDVTGHGTHLSSLIAGTETTLKGLAPSASLTAVKAFDSEDNANFLDVVRAVQWVVENKERLGIRILNLSLSASTELPYHLDPLNRALTKAWESGLVVVVSAGNEGPSESSVTAPGNNPWLISVGAASLNNMRQTVEVAPFSGRGPTASGHIKPNIVAPGVRLAGLLPSDATRPSHEPIERSDAGLWVTSGASQASAVVAGMIALLLEARPELSNDDVKCLIANSAIPLIDENQTVISPMVQGRGLINLSGALMSTNTSCAERLDGLSPSTAIEGAYLPRAYLPQ